MTIEVLGINVSHLLEPALQQGRRISSALAAAPGAGEVIRVHQVLVEQAVFLSGAAVSQFLAASSDAAPAAQRKLLDVLPLVGIIGAGGMLGKRIVMRLLEQGWPPFRVGVAGRQLQKLTYAHRAGAVVYEDVRMLCRACRVVIVCVTELGSLAPAVRGALHDRLVISTVRVPASKTSTLLQAPHVLQPCLQRSQLSTLESWEHLVPDRAAALHIFSTVSSWMESDGQLLRALAWESCMRWLVGDASKVDSEAAARSAAVTMCCTRPPLAILMAAGVYDNISTRGHGGDISWPPKDVLNISTVEGYHSHLHQFIDGMRADLTV
jgi:hypothetical protein